MQKKQPTVLFLVSPSFGLLDNWLPIFFELKKRQPNVKLVALIPKTQTVSEIDPADATLQLGEAVFDEVIFKSRAGFWVVARSLVQAKELSERYHILQAMVGKMRVVLRRSDTLGKMLGFFIRVLTKETHASLDAMRTHVHAICFDVFSKTKKECRALFEYFPTTPRFSICHGLSIEDFNIERGAYDMNYKAYQITAYVYSKHEIESYKRNYGLTDSEIKVTGVSRHDPHWTQKVVQHTKNDIPPSWNNYIFVISRPAIKDFFPREQKKKALEEIKRIAFEYLHAKVVVRLHPTERRQQDGLYEEVFGEQSYGKEWMYSSSHPFVIGKGSVFAIMFYSGVAIDMLALGVPTLQMIDMKPTSKTNAIMEYKKRGFVLGADSYEELKQEAFRIMNQKDTVMRELMPNYEKYFRPARNATQIITDDILKVL